MAETETTGLNNVQKMALILSTLPEDQCVAVLKNYPEEDVERLCREMMNPPKVDEEAKNKIIEEFSCKLEESTDKPALEAMESLLARLYGVRKSTEIAQRLKTVERIDLSSLAEEAGPDVVAQELAREVPSVAAFGLSEIPTALAAKVLTLFPDDFRTEIVMARARGSRLRPDIAVRVREGLKASLESRKSSTPPLDPVEVLATADLLSHLTAEASQAILDSINAKDAVLGRRVAEALFTFDDIVKIDDRDLQRLLSRLNQSDLKLALRKCTDPVSDKIYKNMSERVSAALKDI